VDDDRVAAAGEVVEGAHEIVEGSGGPVEADDLDPVALAQVGEHEGEAWPVDGAGAAGDLVGDDAVAVGKFGGLSGSASAAVSRTHARITERTLAPAKRVPSMPSALAEIAAGFDPWCSLRSSAADF